MQRAGQAAAKKALELLPAAARGTQVLALAGPGNNGGDALEAAAHLAQAGTHVSIVHFPPVGASSAERQTALQRASASAAQFLPYSEELVNSQPWALVIDGLLGIGLQRPLEGSMRQLVAQINTLHCPILALDVPSGPNHKTLGQAREQFTRDMNHLPLDKWPRATEYPA